MTPDEVIKAAKGQLVVFDTLDEVYDYLAEEMVKEFAKAAKGKKIVNFIMPVGPTQPYRLMAEKINYRQISLKNVRFFFMDEYVDDEKDELIPMTNPLSFRGQIGPLLFDRIRPDLLMPKSQIIFPTPENIKDLPKMIQPCGKSVSVEAAEKLFADIGREATKEQRGAAASDKNQLMDELLNQPTIPADYGATMIALFRDETQDVVTRDFAVQHIGLYAQALNRRGRYDPDSRDAQDCRAALFDAADETSTIVAAAAFRALSSIAGFDYMIDAGRLDSMIAASVSDASFAPAVRVMAAQHSAQIEVRRGRRHGCRCNRGKAN